MNGFEIIPNSLDTVRQIRTLRDNNDDPIILGLLIDTHLKEEAPLTSDIREDKRKVILNILQETELLAEFEPIERHMTLSSDIGFTKSENIKGFLNIALKKIGRENIFEGTIFITEDDEHISKANSLGITTIHITDKSDQDLADKEINNISNLTPILSEIINQ